MLKCGESVELMVELMGDLMGLQRDYSLVRVRQREKYQEVTIPLSIPQATE